LAYIAYDNHPIKYIILFIHIFEVVKTCNIWIIIQNKEYELRHAEEKDGDKIVIGAFVSNGKCDSTNG